MNLREMAEAAGFWGWTVWPEELKQFAFLVSCELSGNDSDEVSARLSADTSLTDEPPTP